MEPNPSDSGRAAHAATASLVHSSAAEYLTFVAGSGTGGFEAVWPDPTIVQRALHRLRGGVNVELLDVVKGAAKASRSELILHQIQDDRRRINRRPEGDMAIRQVACTTLEVA